MGGPSGPPVHAYVIMGTGNEEPMPTEPAPVTLSEVVHKAVEVCAPAGGESPGLDELLERFEDRDEPIAAIDDIEAEIDQVLGEVDADMEPEVAMARAVIVYLAHRRDELPADPEGLLRLAARAEFDGEPPPAVQDWLESQGAA
jgi:hypothetical protein